MNKRMKVSIVLNSLIVLFTIFATVSMIFGFEFMGEVKVLSAATFKAFKFFTVDSNVFAGLVSLIYVIFLVMFLRGKISVLPKWLSYLKLAATSAVTLTMMVTVFFLAPRTTTTYFAYFMNANFFMHLITPLLCLITFAFFESYELSFRDTLLGICPMILYSLYYIPNILLHLDNGNVLPEYDWYGFLYAGLNTIWFVVPLIFLITWAFSICIWWLNKKCVKE